MELRGSVPAWRRVPSQQRLESSDDPEIPPCFTPQAKPTACDALTTPHVDWVFLPNTGQSD